MNREMQAAVLTSCPECGGKRVLCDIGLNPSIVFRRVTASGKQTSTGKAIVCLNCGHATIYASDPQNLSLPAER